MERTNKNIMKEISSKELRQINGGFIIAFAALLIILIGIRL
jgi:bacteriocin-like protein